MFVSVGALRRERHHDSSQIPSSSLPAPARNCTPVIILLREQYFEQLFSFLETMDNFIAESGCTDGTHCTETANLSQVENVSEFGCSQNDKATPRADMNPKERTKKIPLPSMGSRIEFFCGVTWELLFLLPTNQTVLSKLKYFGRGLQAGVGEADSDPKQEESGQSQQKVWSKLLDPSYPHKLLYSLQVIDLIHHSSKESQGQSPTYSRVSSDSDISDNEEDRKTRHQEIQAISWGSQFIEFEGLCHLYFILMSGYLEVRDNSIWTQWRQECLAHLLKLICEFGTMKISVDGDNDVFTSSEAEVKKVQIQRRDGQFRVRYKSTDKEEVICIKCLSAHLMSIINVNSLLEKLLHISYQATLPIHGGQNRASGGEGKFLFFSSLLFVNVYDLITGLSAIIAMYFMSLAAYSGSLEGLPT